MNRIVAPRPRPSRSARLRGRISVPPVSSPVSADVRSPATNVSRGFLEFRVGSVASDSETPIVLYCQTGLRSMLAAKALKDLGYSNVVNLQGGYQKWVQSGLPVVKDLPLGTDQIQRNTVSERLLGLPRGDR